MKNQALYLVNIIINLLNYHLKVTLIKIYVFLVVLGSMKTIGFLLTNLLELSKYKKSIIVTDPKAEIYRKTSSYFRSIGYTVKILNLKDMRHSDRWNPLQENEDITDVQTSSNVIISHTQRKGKRWR